ncbi:amidohydrolase family protein [Agromyces archimandritae]|uniref:Amidohydrolase family protein n=1 Tax=Agromyces archimandritae TaxID=2781962 RepID=A0A975FKY1_9MICO|nr:amidohydrolase family protein [Agromyces archimandritae]QTX04410.1 amidohydrolase family protein [Agromyces archimandritae]
MAEPEPPAITELAEINGTSDSRDVLAHATVQAQQSYDDYFVVDIDAHVSEDHFWDEVLSLVDNDYWRDLGMTQFEGFGGKNALLNITPGMSQQSVGGRIGHQGRREPVAGVDGHPFVTAAGRGMDSMGLDYQVVFPSAMLLLGMHPQTEVEVALARAFNRWLTEVILPQDPRLKGMLYLPYNTPEACEELVERYADNDDIIGYTVCSTRNNPVHSDVYLRLYSLIQDSGKPLAFHSGYHWGDPSFAQLNRFLSMHALSFTHYNQIHVTNWIINAMPERFPTIKMLWVESGLAWIPFLMQRLDHEVLMRPSEAPGLTRLPSEYMKEMWYTTQPMERTDMELLEATMKSFNAETQLLYSSDWPHWDWDAPSTITNLPFLSEHAKRNILGLNAARLFNLPTERVKPSAASVLDARPGRS